MQRRLSGSYSSIWSQDFLHRVSPGLFASLGIQELRVLRDATHLRYNFHNSHCIFVAAFSSYVGRHGRSFSAFHGRLFINLMVREQTLIACFTSRFMFCGIDIREDANIHKAISCKYLSKSICTVV